MAYKNLKVVFWMDLRGKWRWHVQARNSKLVCTAGENFASKSNAVRAWKAFKRGMAAL
jgi:uncharacterized protein YegP (UPF0339 family)